MPESQLLIGRTISRFRILEKPGGGGMGGRPCSDPIDCAGKLAGFPQIRPVTDGLDGNRTFPLIIDRAQR